MAIRVVARIRPQQQEELDKDVIVSTISNSDDSLHPTEVRIPNPRNEKETFTYVRILGVLNAYFGRYFEGAHTPKTCPKIQRPFLNKKL